MNLEIIGGALLLLACIFILRELGWRGVPVFAAIGSVIILATLGDSLSAVFTSVGELSSYVSEEYISAILKIIGAGYLFGISADVCRTMGEGQIAKTVEVAGRVEIFLIVLPFFEEIIKLGVSFFE